MLAGVGVMTAALSLRSRSALRASTVLKAEKSSGSKGFSFASFASFAEASAFGASAGVLGAPGLRSGTCGSP